LMVYSANVGDYNFPGQRTKFCAGTASQDCSSPMPSLMRPAAKIGSQQGEHTFCLSATDLFSIGKVGQPGTSRQTFLNI